MINATYQVMNNHTILFYLILTIIVMGPFNYFGACITKEVSASCRCTIDSLRMVTVYLIGIISGNDVFRK